MNRYLLIIPLSVATMAGARAQTSKPDILNAMGGGVSIGGNEFDYSIGEMAVVSTYSAANIVVTQGLLQPAATGHERVVGTGFARGLQVFPNPATSLVHARYTATEHGELSGKLMDMTGRVISEQILTIHAGVNTLDVSVEGLPSASYMLDLALTSAAGQEKASYKIQKLK